VEGRERERRRREWEEEEGRRESEEERLREQFVEVWGEKLPGDLWTSR